MLFSPDKLFLLLEKNDIIGLKGLLHLKLFTWYSSTVYLIMRMDEWCFRPLLCTVKAELGPGTTWANEMNLG